MNDRCNGPVIAYVAVGANIEPEANIAAALERLHSEVPVRAVSTFYRARPLERPEQPSFLNGVWRLLSRRSPRDLKHRVLRPIEHGLGRRRTSDPHAARTLDLDLIVYGDEVHSEVDLVLPDPDIRRRPFVAVPLLELAPGLALPDTGEMLSALPAANDTSELEALREFTELLRRIIEDE